MRAKEISAIYLGNLTVFNPVQDQTAEIDENESALIGTYGSMGKPLSSARVDLLIEGGAEQVSVADHFDLEAIHTLLYDLGDGPTMGRMHMGQLFGATLRFGNGFSVVSAVQILQTETGDTFLLISASQQASFGNQSIQSLEVTSLFQSTRGFAPSGHDGGSFAICFCNGTLINTARGNIPIETLRSGDLVLCDGKGMRPVRWIGCRVLGRPELERYENLRPVRITAGALGDGLPRRDLLISQQHRILVNSVIAERMFGASDVLIAANKLTALAGVFVDYSVEQFAYFHILFDSHEVVFAENIPSESLLLGEQALKSLDAQALAEIRVLFPNILDADKRPVPARTVPKGRMQRKLVQRHMRNKKPFVRELITAARVAA